MKNYFYILTILCLSLVISSCSPKTLGSFGKGVSIGFDPRTVGMQIDDTIMQKGLVARLTMTEKKYYLKIQVEIIDGRIFLSGKVDEPEEKIKITIAKIICKMLKVSVDLDKIFPKSKLPEDVPDPSFNGPF